MLESHKINFQTHLSHTADHDFHGHEQSCCRHNYPLPSGCEIQYLDFSVEIWVVDTINQKRQPSYHEKIRTQLQGQLFAVGRIHVPSYRAQLQMSLPKNCKNTNYWSIFSHNFYAYTLKFLGAVRYCLCSYW